MTDRDLIMSDYIEIHPGEEFLFKVVSEKTKEVLRKHRVVVRKMGGLKRYDIK